MRNEKGITLATLVITIIVLAILASISVYAGNGTIRYVRYNQAKAEIEVVQTHVNSWYQDYNQNGNDTVLSYGALCDNSTLTSISSKSGVTLTANYRKFTKEYLQSTFNIKTDNDFLISVQDRNTLLFNGIQYENKTYYTLEDFGITNVAPKTINSISFELEAGDVKEVVIKNVTMTDSSNRVLQLSEFKTEYKVKDANDNTYQDVSANVIKFTEEENNQNVTKFKFKLSDPGDYTIRITTTDKSRSATANTYVTNLTKHELDEMAKNENSMQEVKITDSSLSNDIKTSNNVRAVVTDGTDRAIIPKGFYYVTGKASTGMVISDVEGDDDNNTKGGNQFVWVPCVAREVSTDSIPSGKIAYEKTNTASENYGLAKTWKSKYSGSRSGI